MATTAAKAAQAETMENNVVAARTKMASVKELEQRDAGGASTLAAELEQREEDMKGVVRKQQERRAKMLVSKRAVYRRSVCPYKGCGLGKAICIVR